MVVIDGKGKLASEPLTTTPPALLKTWNVEGAKLNGRDQGNSARSIALKRRSSANPRGAVRTTNSSSQLGATPPLLVMTRRSPWL